MNQLAMIAKGGESTALSTADGREGFTSTPTNPERCDNSEIQSAFCKLTTAELLKHLLNARVNTRDSSDYGESNESDATKKRRYDSSQEAGMETCGDSTDPSMTKRTFCSKLSSDKCELAGNKSNISYSSCATGRDYNLPQFSSNKHGSMDKQCNQQKQSDNSYQSRLFASEVQNREDVQRSQSEESSQSEQISDEEFSSLSKTILESSALDFILSGTEKKLCIQSPSQNENTSDYSIDSEFSEFTELLPYVENSTVSQTPVPAFSPVASTSGSTAVSVTTSEQLSVNSDKDTQSRTCNNSDQDVENAMVLVPSGAPQRITNSQGGKIVGGHAVDIADYPYQLSLMVRRKYHFCGAVLIARKWALTAAHCTYRVPSYDLFIRAGSTIYQFGGEIIPVSQTIEHENYFPDSADYDIALLELSSPVTTRKAKPIGLMGNRPPAGAIATVSGWGARYSGAKRGPIFLQAVKVPVIDQKLCVAAYSNGTASKYKITDRMFCAGFLKRGGKDSCQGDSGGPIVVGGALAGIVSWGFGCAVAKYPGVYTNIAEFWQWVVETINLHTVD